MDGQDVTASSASFTLRQLEYFVAAAGHRTLRAAAEELNISPSALSDAISDLERQFGEALAIRKKARGLALTSAGQVVLDHARRVLAEARLLQRALGAEQEVAGPVVIGCHPGLVPSLMPLVLVEYAAIRPAVELSFVEGTDAELTRLLREGQVDVAFVYNDADLEGAAHIPLFNLVPHVLIPAGHRLAGRTSIALHDLADEDFVLLDSIPSAEKTLSLFRRRGIRPRVRYRTRSYEAVRALVGRGLGYTVVIGQPARRVNLDRDRLVMRPLDPVPGPVRVLLMWRPDARVAPRVKEFVEFVEAIDWRQAFDTA